MFEKIFENSPATWGAVIALALIGAGVLTLSRDRNRWTTRTLAIGALCVALSFLLSCIRMYRMPQGGSVTLASALPLLAYAYYFGTAPGLLAGAALGFLQLLQDFYFLNFTQMLLDYPIAFGALALAGLFRKLPRSSGLYVGIAVGSLARFFCSVLSGVVFFAEYAPPEMNPWIYSLGYNGSYMGIEVVICLVVAAVPAVRATLERLSNQMIPNK
ncbi:MAG: energy-coupled thiamine transporter ThiT [Oscillospiraceae bacterium]|jgi:thiamine transporter|nr:energy-coupled thiamine transporter ThiT [Oscillospiraceae bacterium]